MPANERRCDLCDYWQASGEVRGMPKGECHYDIPKHTDHLGIARWIETPAEQWCGRFKKIAVVELTVKKEAPPAKKV